MINELANTLLRPGLLNNQLEWLFGGICIMVWVLFLIVAILVCIWLYRDAESRGMSGVLWVILLIIGALFTFGWIIILIIYLVVRKPKVTGPPPYGGMVPPPAYAPPPGYVAAPPPGYQGAPPPQPPAYGAPQPMAVNCRYCGSPVPPGSVVCPRCGGRQ